jgi:hypothetical protein
LIFSQWLWYLHFYSCSTTITPVSKTNFDVFKLT